VARHGCVTGVCHVSHLWCFPMNLTAQPGSYKSNSPGQPALGASFACGSRSCTQLFVYMAMAYMHPHPHTHAHTPSHTHLVDVCLPHPSSQTAVPNATVVRHSRTQPSPPKPCPHIQYPCQHTLLPTPPPPAAHTLSTSACARR
jgi:hypothetical protein